MKRQLHLNLFIHGRGHHEASWRHPASSPLPLTDIRYYQDLAQRAEAALFDSIFWWLAFINAALGAFNLVPAFPLDGGRLLSSFFWWRQGSRQRGVHTAVRIGRFVAYLMIAIGVIEVITPGGVIDGIWLAFLGWFLLSAGQSEETGTVIRSSLRSVPVSAAMSSPVVTIPDWLSVEQFLESVAPAHHFATYPIHDPSGRLSPSVERSEQPPPRCTSSSAIMPTEEILRSALWNSPTVISSSAATSASLGVRRKVASRCVTACSTARALVRTERGTQSMERSSSMIAPLIRGIA